MYRSRLLPSCLILATLVSLAVSACRAPSPPPPFELGVWFWHSPFEIPAGQVAELRETGATKVFVRAGTFSTNGKDAVLVIPQSYKDVADVETHLVFNFDSGFVKHFEKFDLENVSQQAAERITLQVNRVKGLGIDPKGIQLDLDCPSRLLPRYAEFVRRIKKRVAGDLQWSTTALTSWLGTDGAATLSEELDFMVPQAYEGVTGQTIDEMRPVADPAQLRTAMKKAEGLRCPFYIGIPAYGHGFVYDSAGKLIDIYQQASPADLMMNPGLTMTAAYPSDAFGQPAKDRDASVGEQIVKFRALPSGRPGKPQGHQVAFSVPSLDLLRKMLALAKENAGPNCRGAIIFRYPEPDASLTLAFPGFMSILKGGKHHPKLIIESEKTVDNFGLIEEEEAGRALADVTLAIRNSGESATFISPDAIVITLEFERPGLSAVRLRDFERSRPGRITKERKFEPTLARDATAIQIEKSYLRAGEVCYVGPVRLSDSQNKVKRIEWIIRDSNGFDRYSGSTTLAPPKP